MNNVYDPKHALKTTNLTTGADAEATFVCVCVWGGGGGGQNSLKWRVSGGVSPGKFLNFESLKRHFLYFEGTFEQNIKVFNHIFNSVSQHF